MSLPRLRALEQEALHPRVCGICKGEGEVFRNPSWPYGPAGGDVIPVSGLWWGRVSDGDVATDQPRRPPVLDPVCCDVGLSAPDPHWRFRMNLLVGLVIGGVWFFAAVGAALVLCCAARMGDEMLARARARENGWTL